ncbi:hypothetical protein ACKP2L_05135 [Oenococcus alcoholitolerans]|uniref:hypothetical protein n=1 Tax=Oenococcus alcoholitolerans TaxID=931074 RepID=UPI003F730045
MNKDFHSDFSISSVNHAVLSFQRGEYKNLIRQPRIKENNSKAKEFVTAKKSVDDNGNITSIDFDIKFEDFRKRSNKSPEDILKFAGYDIKDWQVSNITNNDWSVTNKDGDKYWNHQVKLSAKPRNKSGLSIDEIIYLFNKNIEPVHIRQESQPSFKTNLVIPLVDLHFSEMTYEEYLPYLKGIKQIVVKGYKTIVIEQLGDLFDSDKINSEETVKGTQLEDGNMPQAVEDASKFIFDLIQFSIKHSTNFAMKYVGGNHDFDESYMFQWAIKQRFP